VFLEKSNEKDNKPPGSEKSSRSTSPALSTKSDSSETSMDKKVTFPAAAVTKDSVRDKCREMIVNSLKITEGFEASKYLKKVEVSFLSS